MMITKKIYRRELVIFWSLFILFTIIGTVSHELGHILVARMKGYTTTLHYASMNSEPYPIQQQLMIYDQEFMENRISEEEYTAKRRKAFASHEQNRIWIQAGGPLQTMLTGTIGLILLLRRRRKISEQGMKAPDWLLVFLSLFWLREVFNMGIGFVKALIKKGNLLAWKTSGDEARLSVAFGWHPATLNIILGLLGIIIASYVIFRIVPPDKRLTFITGGLIGGTCGFALWMLWIGPQLLP